METRILDQGLSYCVETPSLSNHILGLNRSRQDVEAAENTTWSHWVKHLRVRARLADLFSGISKG